MKANTPEALKGRQLKKEVLSLLQSDPFDAALQSLRGYPPRRVVNPLISFFLHADPMVSWRAITAMGRVVATLAETQMESARVVMRRLMWSLNDESGGIGWGAPQAMGQIMAQSAPLAEEYSAILISYIDPRCNYLEHEGLQRGALWAVACLAHARPGLAQPAAAFLPPFFSSPDPCLRGTSIWAAGPILDTSLRRLIGDKLADDAAFDLYRQGKIASTTVGELAREALSGDPNRRG